MKTFQKKLFLKEHVRNIDRIEIETEHYTLVLSSEDGKTVTIGHKQEPDITWLCEYSGQCLKGYCVFKPKLLKNSWCKWCKETEKFVKLIPMKTRDQL